MSSDHLYDHTGVPSGDKAVDGLRLSPNGADDGSYTAHTNEDSNPWLRVNLEALYCVLEVNVHNRASK